MQELIATGTMRLDVFLANTGAAASRIKARDMVKDGLVLVNGRIARKPALVLKEGDQIQVSATGEPVTETRLHTADLQLEVLYEDDACMVINKPAGISVHPGAGIPDDADTILHGIAHLFAERTLPFSSSAVLVHRLDKDTTGCLLIAKNPAAHKALQMQFEKRTVEKTYLAIVAGVPDPPAAIIEASIGRSSHDRTKMTVYGSNRSREAKTTYRTLCAGKEASLIACDLHTGRTHQIRVHMSTIGHAILGDATYTSVAADTLAAAHDIKSICLHARTLTFRSPSDETKRTVTAPLPSAFLGVLHEFGLQEPKEA
ncbi:MAG TPA: RluA family pseudouridine synthase [Candidatus Peribacteraceae bacterium]|nr:RluA family pseudouridine synthase [Candidatus Peribacteraceae bacterium]